MLGGRARNVPLATAVVASAVLLAALAVHLWVRPLPGLPTLEALSIDARFHLRGPRPPATDRIVIVGIDDKTRERFPEVLQTRAGWAHLVHELSAYYGVKVIAIDVFFSDPEVILPPALARDVRRADEALRATPPPDDARDLASLVSRVADELRGDDKLAAAIAQSHRVYLGAFFEPGRDDHGAAPPGLQRARVGDVADGGAGGARRPMTLGAVDFSLPQIARGAVGAGAVNRIADPDGVTRRIPLAVAYHGGIYMSLGLAVALDELGRPHDTHYVVGARELVAAGRALPLGDAASLSLDVLGKDELPRVSAADVLAHTAPRAALAGKLAFVGLTYASSDKVELPLEPTADGIELHATLAENVLTGHLLRRAGAGWTLIAALALCALVTAAQLRRVRRHAWAPPVIALAGLALYAVLAQLAFAHGTIVAVATPSLVALLALAAATIGGLATEGREKAHLRAAFSQYVSPAVVDRLLADPSRARLGGERRELTVLFSDIRGFSHLAEGMRPEELASFLGEYLTPMTELVMDSGGTLDKYIGDAIMAIWAAPIDYPDHAERACEVALRMQEMLAVLNRTWRAHGKPELAIGVGINTGPMAVGNMGSAARFDYTVLGDNVNLASRLEGLTKEYGIGILAGEGTARAAGGRFAFREIDLVRVKGRSAAAPVFELVGRTGARVDPRFAEALAAYRRRDFPTAREAFAALPDDAAARALATRCEMLAADPPEAEWDGVFEQRAK